jgi:16S rRNA (cytosine1402-N4)-methyltransferase
VSGHIPVLFEEVMTQFRETPTAIRRYLDTTFGRGGHTRGILRAFPEAKVVAVDQDIEAIHYGEQNFADEILNGRLRLVHAKFWELETIADLGTFELILADLGVSSPQLDQAQRGFSFYHQGPLDMRMDQRDSTTAADIINTWSEDELNELFQKLGEVSRPYRVTRAIVHDRDSKPFQLTTDLAQLIERVEGWARKGHHPATQYFLALRLEVNQELARLEEGLRQLITLLSPQGRLAVITFHSLEDRIVKQTFKSELERGRLVNKKVIAPKWADTKTNPRARSAKLRVFEKQGGTDNES